MSGHNERRKMKGRRRRRRRRKSVIVQYFEMIGRKIVKAPGKIDTVRFLNSSNSCELLGGGYFVSEKESMDR